MGAVSCSKSREPSGDIRTESIKSVEVGHGRYFVTVLHTASLMLAGERDKRARERCITGIFYRSLDLTSDERISNCN